MRDQSKKTIVWKAKASRGWFVRFPAHTPIYFDSFHEVQFALRCPEFWVGATI